MVPMTKSPFLGQQKNIVSSGSPGELVKTRNAGPHSPVSDLIGPGWGPRVCFSSKFPGSSGNHTLRSTVLEGLSPSPGLLGNGQVHPDQTVAFQPPGDKDLTVALNSLETSEDDCAGFATTPLTVFFFSMLSLPGASLNVFCCWVGLG